MRRKAAPPRGCAELAAAPEADPTPRTPQGCQECLELGVHTWANLRLCLDCGHVGCCDSSEYRHATAHYESAKHPVMRSFEPGETWRWCFVHSQLG
ncbi:MAG: UBP-type zinc finger domain-containing protein [Mycobacteriaceae bacterium]